LGVNIIVCLYCLLYGGI